MRLLFTVLAGLATAASQCSSSWYFQAGKQYNYEVVTENSVLFADKGFEGDSRAAEERVEGVLSLNVVADCVAEVTFLHSRRRESSSARVFFGAGSINSVAFPEGQSVTSSNGLKAILSALQLNESGVRHHPAVVGEVTHNGYSDSKYTCNCGCVECECESCDGIVVTRVPTMVVDTSHSGRSLVLQTLTGKLAIDRSLDITMEPIVCKYAVRKTIPESVHCQQTVRGSDIDTLVSSITITYDSEGSAESVLASTALAPAESLKIRHTGHFNDVCSGDINCVIDIFTSVISNDHNAVKNQFLLRKSIRALTAAQLSSIVGKVAVDHNSITHLFTELTKCQTGACQQTVAAMLESVELPVYPAVFRAVQYSAPTEQMINLMANDIMQSSSVEKLNIFMGAVKEVELTNYASVLSVVKTLIGDSCQAVHESFTLSGYFLSQKETTETEMVIALKIAQVLGPEIVRPVLEDITKCLTYKGAATIAENAIVAIGPFYTAEQIISNVPVTTPATVAAIVIAIRESNAAISTADIYGLFQAKYGDTMTTDKAFINQIILALDNTEAVEADYRWSKSLRLPLPVSLEEVELFSGLTLSSHINTKGASVIIKNELVNGEGLRLVEGDIIINSMYDMLKYSLSGYYKCPESLWTAVLATENSMITLIESIINLNLENVLTNNALSNIRAFIQMGGVQFKLLGEEVNADAFVSLFENIQQFLTSEKTSYKPTLAEVYSIFASGLEHNYFNVFDSRETMTVGLVSGMQVTSTVASITAVGYNGIILPHLMSLGNTGDIRMSPSFSHGIVSETKLRSFTLDKAATTVFSTHASLSGELAYEKSASGLELSLRISPSTSPMTMHRWQYMDNDFSERRHMTIQTYPILASNIIVRSCNEGYEISLDREISVHLLTRMAKGTVTLSGNVEGLGALTTTVSGTVLDGAVSAEVISATGVRTSVQVRSECLSVANCAVTGDVALPNMAPISSTSRLEFTSPTLSFRSQNMIGKRSLLHMMVDASPALLRIASKSDTIRAASTVVCRHNLLEDSPAKTASCDLSWNEKFGVISLNKEKNTYSWDIKTNVMAVLGSFNLRRQLDLQVFKYPSTIYTNAAELTPDVLSAHEIVDLDVAWPQLSSDSRLVAFQLELRQRTVTKFRLQQSSSGHRVNLIIPALDLRFFNNWDATAMQWVHRVQMNPRKLERLLSRRLRSSIMTPLLDARGLMVHQVSVSYPSSASCSQQFATPEGSVVTRINLGTSDLCFSAGAGHIAARSHPSANWAPTWGTFDFYSGFSGANKAAVVSLVNEMLTAKLTGDWLIETTGENKRIALGTSIKASGAIMPESFAASVEVSGQHKGNKLVGLLNAEYQGTPVQLQVNGKLAKVTVGGIVTDAILLYPTKNNIFNLQEVGIHMINNFPAGITLKQKDFNAKWIVDVTSPAVLIDIVNRDTVIPLTKFLFRADSTAMNIHVDGSLERNLRLNVEYASGVTGTLRLPSVLVDITKNDASDHRIDIAARNIGELACVWSPKKPLLKSLTLINLGIDTTMKNLRIAEGVRLSGSTLVLADKNGVKSNGFKIHHVLHVLGYDINIDTEVFSNAASDYTPVDAPFKWCDVDGEISFGWIQVFRRNSRIVSFGNWMRLGSDKCSNTIAIYKEQYHQLAVMTAGGVKKARLMVPTSYHVTAPATWDLVLSDKIESSLSLPVANVYVTADRTVFTLSAIGANDVVIADSLLDIASRHLKVVVDLTTFEIPVVTSIETGRQDKKWQHSIFDITVGKHHAAGELDINVSNWRTDFVSSGTILGLAWDSEIHFINPFVHKVSVNGSWTSKSSSLFGRTQAVPFTFISDIHGYSHIKLGFTGFDVNLAHDTTIAISPLNIKCSTLVTSPWVSITAGGDIVQDKDMFNSVITAKTGSYEGFLKSSFNSAMTLLSIDYHQTGIAQILLGLNAAGGSLKIDAPIVDLISTIEIARKPMSLSITGQYVSDSINLLATKEGISLDLSNILSFKSKHADIITADLTITSQGSYHLEFQSSKIQPFRIDITDKSIGTHSLIVTAATIDMVNTVEALAFTSSLRASLALPVEIVLEGSFKGPFHVMVSQGKSAGDILIAGNSIKISKSGCDIVIEFNNAVTEARGVICTKTTTVDLIASDATYGKVEVHVAGPTVVVAIASEALATTGTFKLNAAPESFLIDLQGVIAGSQVVTTVSVPDRKVIVTLPAIRSLPPVNFALTEAKGVITNELVVGKIINRMTIDINNVIVTIDGKIVKQYSILFSLPERTFSAAIDTIVNSLILSEKAGVISSQIDLGKAGSNIISVDTTKWIISVKNTILKETSIFFSLPQHVVLFDIPSIGHLELSEAKGVISKLLRIEGVGENTLSVDTANWIFTNKNTLWLPFEINITWPGRSALIKVPGVCRIELSETQDAIVLKTNIKGVINTASVQPGSWIISAEGTIVTPYSVSISTMDIYNRIMSVSVPMSADHFLRVFVPEIISLEVTPTVASLTLAENKFITVTLAGAVLNVDAAWLANTIKATFNSAKIELNLAAALLGNTIETYVSAKSPVVAHVTIRTQTKDYSAVYENGRLIISVPEVASIDVTVVDRAIRGTIDITGIAEITVNNMVLSPVTVHGVTIFVVTDVNMVANIAGFQLQTVASLTDSGITYQIACDVGAGLILNLSGKTSAVIPTEALTNLMAYKVLSEMNFSLGNEYITQGLSYSARLAAGNIDSTVTINTALLKVELAIATEKLSLKKFITRNLLINTEINGSSVFTTGGISFVAGEALEIYETQVKSGSDSLFIIGGGATIPIAFDLRTMKFLPNDHLVIRVKDVRIVAKLMALDNFELNVSDMVVLSRKNKIVHGAVTVGPLAIVSDIELLKSGFRQAVRVNNGESKLVDATHSLDLSAGSVNLDWLVLDNVIKADLKYLESAIVNIRSSAFKLQSEVTAAHFNLAISSTPIRLQADITPSKLDCALASEVVQLKVTLTPDLVDNMITIRTSNNIKINANSESLSKMKLQINTPVAKAMVNVNDKKIDGKILSGSVLVVANCKDLCRRSHVKISNGEVDVLETTLVISGNAFVANVVAGELVVTVQADPTTTSVATITFKELYNLTGKLSAGRVFEITFETPETLVRVNNSSFVMVHQPLNIEARVNETPGKVVIRINPSKDLLVNFSRLPTGEVTLAANIYTLVVADVKLVKGVLTSDITVIDTNIKARIAPNNARIAITGDNLNANGTASAGKFHVNVVAPVKGSVDYKNETMVVTTTTRTYTLTSENGLIKVLPKIRAA